MDKSWFNFLGKYDMDMDIWGGENFGELLPLCPGAGVGNVCPGTRCVWEKGQGTGTTVPLWGKAGWGTREGALAGRMGGCRQSGNCPMGPRGC